MKLTEDGIRDLTVIKTEFKKQLRIDGRTESYPVYEIRLDKLFYNDRNDRIATWMSKYIQDNQVECIDMSDMEAYNNIIEEFVVESKPEAMKKTRNNISAIGQQEYGVVLNDGRIIDGNRRFTCLRQIQRESGQTQYFKAVILLHDYEHSAKQIKMLELQLQQGVDRPVDYDGINQLVGLYKTIREEKLLTIEEYANSISASSTRVVERDLELADLMVEYLEFINAPKQYHIAREMRIYESLKTIKKMLDSYKGSAESKEDLKSVLFTDLLLQPGEDMSRGFLRKVDKIVKSKKHINDYIDEQMQTVEAVVDTLDSYPEVDERIINEKLRTDEIKQNVLKSTEKYLARATGDASRNEPSRVLQKAYDDIEGIDTLIFLKLDDNQRAEVGELIDNVIDLLDRIKGELDV